ncbi:hypothetical protein GCM10027612_85550 [Microbispora bryophytorum subsp. camponoti]
MVALRGRQGTGDQEAFGISATRYYQLLGELIDRPEALEHDPMLVKRLRRMRAAGGATARPAASDSTPRSPFVRMLPALWA